MRRLGLLLVTLGSKPLILALVLLRVSLITAMTVLASFSVTTVIDAATLTPARSFPIPAFPDPDINVNGLAFGGGKLFALNNFHDPAINSTRGNIYALDPNNGTVLNSFASPACCAGLASNGVSLYVNSAGIPSPEGAIFKLDPSTGSVLQTITPSGVTITGGAGGLAFLNGDLFEVAATVECGGVSVVRIKPEDGTFLGCFNVDSLGISPRELDADGTHLLYGTWVADQDSPMTFNWTVFMLSTSGQVLQADVLFSTQADNEDEATSSFDVNGLACGNNELYVADRSSNQILVYPFPCSPSGFLSFPLGISCNGIPCTAYTAKISAVMDHSGTPLDSVNPGAWYKTKNGEVKAYTGETGNAIFGIDCGTNYLTTVAPGYKNVNGDDFIVNGHYVGAVCSTKPKDAQKEANKFPARFLNYDGHSGYDYPYPANTPILAPAAGKLYKAANDPINHNSKCKNNDGWNEWRTFYIDHENGFTTWYLHADRLRPDIEAQIGKDFTKFAMVEKDQTIAFVGNYGKCSRVGFHLHFEVRQGLGQIVDPYSSGLWIDNP